MQTQEQGGQESPTEGGQESQEQGGVQVTQSPEQLVAMLKAAREEAASYRIKARESSEKLQQIEEEKKLAQLNELKEKEQFKTLYEQKEAEYNELKKNYEEAKQAKEVLTAIQAERKKTLLQQIPETKRDEFADFSVEQLEKVIGMQTMTKNTPGGERQQAHTINTAPPVMPFQTSSETTNALVKIFGG